jgi:hypothetical protein
MNFKFDPRKHPVAITLGLVAAASVVTGREKPALEVVPAPALPFSYFGRLTQNGTTEVFVMRGDELISIAAGRNIDAEYRVEAITPSVIRFTYLPLNTRQTLELDEAGA